MALFEVIDPNAGPAPPGPWETRPAPAASFSAGATGEPQAPVWRVSLPADPAVAHAELRSAEAALARQEAAMAAAPARLRALAAGRRAASFGLADTPETRLLALMGQASAGDASSFGLGRAETPALDEAQGRFQSFVNQVQDAVTNFAVVETRVERALIARTTVSWTGDTRSLLGAGIAAEQEALHRRSLALALHSRAALLRTFAIVVRGAALVTMMASSPAGALYALPGAWKFVDDLLREERARRQAPSPA